METVTIKKLTEFGCVYEAIQWAMDQQGKYVSKPSKPRLSSNADSKEAKQYAADLEQQEKDLIIWEQNNNTIKKFNQDIENVIVEYIKDVSDLNNIPEQYRDKVYYFAYSEGHSGGYTEVYNKLIDLVDIFN